jgi:hypothetical protein
MRIAVFLTLLIVTLPAAAREAPVEQPDRRCFYGTLAFSPGAEVAIGNLRYVCNGEAETGVWERSINPKLIPHCLHSGELTALGGVVVEGGTEVSCMPNGMWE